jgi:hypothetical protein
MPDLIASILIDLARAQPDQAGKYLREALAITSNRYPREEADARLAFLLLAPSEGPGSISQQVDLLLAALRRASSESGSARLWSGFLIELNRLGV